MVDFEPGIRENIYSLEIPLSYNIDTVRSVVEGFMDSIPGSIQEVGRRLDIGIIFPEKEFEPGKIHERDGIEYIDSSNSKIELLKKTLKKMFPGLELEFITNSNLLQQTYPTSF